MGLGCVCIVGDLEIAPLIAGKQNNGLRGGTENIPMIAGNSKCMDIVWSDRPTKNMRLIELKTLIISRLLRHFKYLEFDTLRHKQDDYFPNISTDSMVILSDPNNINTLYFSIIIATNRDNHFCNLKMREYLAKNKIIISVGSTCNTTSSKPSHVLFAIGAPFIGRCGTMRVSFSDYTTKCEVGRFIDYCVRGVQLQKQSFVK